MSRNQNGESSVWPRADGRWSGAAYVRTHTGRVERRYVYGKTEKDALAKLIKVQEKDAQGVPARPTKYMLADFLAEWLEHMRHHVRPKTWTGYENNVRLRLMPRLGKKKLTALRSMATSRSTPSARPSAGWTPSSTSTTPRRTDRCCQLLLASEAPGRAHPA